MTITTKYGVGDIVRFAYPYKSGNIINAVIRRVEISVNEKGNAAVKYYVSGECGFIYVKQNHLL